MPCYQNSAMPREGLRKRKTVYPTKSKKTLPLLGRKSVGVGLKRSKGRPKKSTRKSNGNNNSKNKTSSFSKATIKTKPLSPTSAFEKQLRKSFNGKQKTDKNKRQEEQVDDDGSVFPYGLLYVERLKSFLLNQWPVKRGQGCDPHHLAMAGFLFNSKESELSAKCFACFHTINDLTANSNPWMKHEKVNPDCIMLRFGRKEKPDDYTMEQILEMCKEAANNKLEEAMQYCEAYLMRNLKILADSETLSDSDEDEIATGGGDNYRTDSISDDDDNISFEEQPSFIG